MNLNELNELINNLNIKITGRNQLDYNEENASIIQTDILLILNTYEQMIEEFDFTRQQLDIFNNRINIGLNNFWQWGIYHLQDKIQILEDIEDQDQITQELLDTTVLYLKVFGDNVYIFIKNIYEQNQRLFRKINIKNFYEFLCLFQGQVISLVNRNIRHHLDNLLNLEYTIDIDREIYSRINTFYGNAFFTNDDLYIPQQIQQSVPNLQFAAAEKELFEVYYQMYINFLVNTQVNIFSRIDDILNTSQSDSEQSMLILTELVSFYEDFAEFHKDQLPNQTSVVYAAITAWTENRNIEAAINQQRQKLGIMPTSSSSSSTSSSISSIQNLATSSIQNLATSSMQNLANQDQKKVNQRRNGFLKGLQKRRNQAKGRSSTSSSSSNLQLDINKQELKEMMKALQTRQKQIQTRQKQVQTRQKQLQTKRQQLQRQKNAPSETPAEFLCPITHEEMQEPVITNRGISFEKKAIEEWLRSANRCPVSRQPLRRSDLRENLALKTLIDSWNKKQMQKESRRQSLSRRQSSSRRPPESSSSSRRPPESSSSSRRQPSSSRRQSQSSSRRQSSSSSSRSSTQPERVNIRRGQSTDSEQSGGFFGRIRSFFP